VNYYAQLAVLAMLPFASIGQMKPLHLRIGGFAMSVSKNSWRKTMSEQLREKITDICKKMDTRLCILHDVNHIYPPDDTPRGVLPAQRYDIYPCPPGYEGDPEMCLVCAVDQILTAIEEGIEVCKGCGGRGEARKVAGGELWTCDICGGKGWVTK